MKVDKVKLIEKVAEKSGLETGVVEKQIDKLIQTIRKTTGEGKALEIKGVGMFYRSQDGELTFESSEEFATEINYQYAGMEPVQLELGADPVSSEADPQQPLGRPEAEGPGESAEDPAETPQEPMAADVPGGKTASGEEKSKAARKTRSEAQQRIGKREQNSIRNLIITVIVVGIMAVTLIYVLDLNRTGTDPVATPEPDPIEERSEVGPTDRGAEPAESGVVTDGTDEETEPMSEDPAIPEVDEEESQEAAVPAYGLHGETADIEGRYYSIVLHSMGDRFRAEEIADRLRDEGYRDVLYRIVSDEHGTMWRVGVGQFESIETAQEAADELSRSMRDDHFIGRIQ